MEFRNSIPQITYKAHEKPISKEVIFSIAVPLLQYLDEYPNHTDNWQIHWRLAQFFLEHRLKEEAFFHLQETLKLAPEKHQLELTRAVNMFSSEFSP